MKRFVPTTIFNRFGIMIDRTDYLRGSVYCVHLWKRGYFEALLYLGYPSGRIV